MNTPVKVALIIAGTVELAIRLLFLLILGITLFGAIILFGLCEADPMVLARSWCFGYLEKNGSRQIPTGDALLSRRQLQQLEFERRKLAIQKEHNEVLRETRKLEGEIFGS
jgi:hypothetical protein